MKHWRINLILIFVFLFGAAIISRLVFLQLLDQEYWKALARGQQKFFEEIGPKRGEIFIKDKAGNLYALATNKDFDFVYLVPEEIKNKSEVAIILSSVLSLDENLISEKLKAEESLFVVLKNKLNYTEVQNLKDLNLAGVYLEKEQTRYYPLGSLASHLLGFVGGEGSGQYGIEGFYNDILTGEKGFLEGERNPAGYSILFDDDFSPAEKGNDLILTIDYNIQFLAEKSLKEAKENLEIESGTIIVADPNSGKILALANLPNFDPNEYSKTKMDIFQNSAVQKLFEPGSVFKPITMASALDKEKITPQTTYHDPGMLKIDGWPIYNYDGRTYPGEITMTEVLEKSINTGAVFAEKEAGHETFLDYVEKFGFFEETGIDLQEEVWSENKNLRSGREINCATASFGQGVEITPMQLVRAFSAIANGGKLIKPFIVEPPTTFQGEGAEQTNYAKSGGGGEQVISSKTASQLQAMMVSVVESAYTRRARVPGYYIAGKTGTAQIPWTALGIQKSGYSEKTIQSFLGFAPAFNAKFLILVKLDNPNTKTAEYSAVPIFRELAKYIIDYWQIPPDYEVVDGE
jgi:cell division protein FtsI/penicillin-binding protein 2